MGIVHVPDSAWAKEATQWEAQSSTMGPGLRPYVKRDYPMMLHRADQLPAGGIAIVETQIVEHAGQRSRYETRGFAETPLEAIAVLEARQHEAAVLAAERGYEKKHKLSPKAIAEVDAAEADASGHLPTIAEKPIRKSHHRKPSAV